VGLPFPLVELVETPAVASGKEYRFSAQTMTISDGRKAWPSEIVITREKIDTPCPTLCPVRWSSFSRPRGRVVLPFPLVELVETLRSALIEECRFYCEIVIV
jgi:hypothetical protein